MIERLFIADFKHGNDVRQQLRWERSCTILSGAYHLRHDLELGVAMWAVTADTEAKQGVDLKRRGVAWGHSDPSHAQERGYGRDLRLEGQTERISTHASYGDFPSDGNNVENFLVICSPVRSNSCCLSDGERLGHVSGLSFQPGSQMDRCAHRHGDTSTWHPSSTPPTPLAGNSRVEYLLLQSVHVELETSWLTLFGRQILDDTAHPLRDPPSLSMEIESDAGSSSSKEYLWAGGDFMSSSAVRCRQREWRKMRTDALPERQRSMAPPLGSSERVECGRRSPGVL